MLSVFRFSCLFAAVKVFAEDLMGRYPIDCQKMVGDNEEETLGLTHPIYILLERLGLLSTPVCIR